MTGELELFEVEQGTDEWRQCRVGIPTASAFSKVLAAGDGKVRSKYMRQLVGEAITGSPMEEYRGGAMDRGNAMEPALRALYAMISGENPVKGPFFRRRLEVGFCGYSPDALVGNDGQAEFKSSAPDLLIEIFDSGRVPAEHIPQVQGGLFVSGRKWCDVAIGYADPEGHFNSMPLFRRRILRDTAYIARLELALVTFNRELESEVARVRAFR